MTITTRRGPWVRPDQTGCASDVPAAPKGTGGASRLRAANGHYGARRGRQQPGSSTGTLGATDYRRQDRCAEGIGGGDEFAERPLTEAADLRGRPDFRNRTSITPRFRAGFRDGAPP